MNYRYPKKTAPTGVLVRQNALFFEFFSVWCISYVIGAKLNISRGFFPEKNIFYIYLFRLCYLHDKRAQRANNVNNTFGFFQRDIGLQGTARSCSPIDLRSR